MLRLILLALALPLPRDADRVVVVCNDDSKISRSIADDYGHRRHVENRLSVHCSDSATATDRETIPYARFKNSIETPLRAFLASHQGVDFIVLTKGVPIRIEGASGHWRRREAAFPRQLPGGAGLRPIARWNLRQSQ